MYRVEQEKISWGGTKDEIGSRIDTKMAVSVSSAEVEKAKFPPHCGAAQLGLVNCVSCVMHGMACENETESLLHVTTAAASCDVQDVCSFRRDPLASLDRRRPCWWSPPRVRVLEFCSWVQSHSSRRVVLFYGCYLYLSTSTACCSRISATFHNNGTSDVVSRV